MGIGASLVLIAIGLILALALQLDTTPVGGMSVEWDTVGWILAAVGVAGLIWSLVLLSAARHRDIDVVEHRPGTRVID